MAFPRADVLLVVPLYEEYDAIRTVIPFTEVAHAQCPPGLKTLFEATLDGLRVVACVLMEMANEHSSMVTERCIHHLNPTLVIGLGIAGSLDDDAKLGDVVVSRIVENVVFESKAVPRKEGPARSRSRGKASDPSASYGFQILPSANGSIEVPEPLVRFAGSFAQLRDKEFAVWQDAGRQEREALKLRTRVVPKSARPRSRAKNKASDARPKRRLKELRTIAGREPSLVLGAIASGPSVGASSAYVAHLKSIGRDFRALEMEGAGIARACQKRWREPKRNYLLLRGISDFSDETKKDLEASSKSRWRQLACHNAARLLRAFLDDGEFRFICELPARGRVHHDAREIVRVAIQGNDSVHYVNSISQGFKDGLCGQLGEKYRVVYEEAYGSPEARDLAANESLAKELVGRFGDDAPHYFVTIGTGVTYAAIRALPPHLKLFYLGVSDPEAAKLTERQKTERPYVTGIRYGLPIETTVGILREAFPNRRLVFVHCQDRFHQDSTLMARLKEARLQDVDLLSLDAPGPLASGDSKSVFFGRFFFCKNMAEFRQHNPRAVLVGVSRENIGRGAVMSIGYDTGDTGREGARHLVEDWFGRTKLPDDVIFEPGPPVIALSVRRLRECRVSLPATFSRKVECYSDS